MSSYRPIRFRGVVVAAASILAVLAGAPPASPTTVSEGSIFVDLELAHSVLIATLAGKRVEVDSRGVPQTVYELGDVDAVKGEYPYPFEIRLDGGEIEPGVGLKVHGVPQFSNGERVLLFLRMDQPVAPIIGLEARAFRIVGDRGRESVTTYDGRPILGLDATLRVKAGTDEDRGLTLRQFVDILREMMAQPQYQDRSR